MKLLKAIIWDLRIIFGNKEWVHEQLIKEWAEERY